MSVLNNQKNTAINDWSRPFIIAALKDKGWSLRYLAEVSGYSVNTLKSALDKPYPNMERIIADAIGVPPEQIWPIRYARRNFRPTLKRSL